MLDGLSTRITSGGIPVLTIHYSADEAKRPGTPAGDAWLEAALMGYPGGLANPRWQKEMEIKYGAMGGVKLFPQWDQWKRNGAIVIPRLHLRGYQLYGSYDHGWRHPGCYLVHGINSDGCIITAWEMYGAHIPYQLWCKAIKGEDVLVHPCGGECHSAARVFPGNPYAGEEILRVADPSIWSEDQQQKDGTMRSLARLFRSEGVFLTEAQRGMDTTVAEWFHGHWWADPLKPLWRITENCGNLIREIGLQRHKELGERTALSRSQPEELVDKDNDAFDSLKYFAQRFPPAPQEKKMSTQPNSFAWWQQQAKRAKEGKPVQTYQRSMVG